jgi:hypothetical protein
LALCLPRHKSGLFFILLFEIKPKIISNSHAANNVTTPRESIPL